MFKGVCKYDTGIESIAQMIDTVMNCLGIFKELPIINTAISAYKETQNLINKHNLIKLKNFIDSLNDGLVADEELKTELIKPETLNNIDLLTKLSKEQSSLEEVVSKYKRYKD